MYVSLGITYTYVYTYITNHESPNHEKQRFWPPENQVIYHKKPLNI